MKIHLINIILLLIPVLAFGQTFREIKFIWKAAESDSHRFEKAVMLIPIKFQSDTTTYFLQFDTGATQSYLYSNRLEWFNSSDKYLETSIGKIKFRDNKAMKATDEKIASIGTLGADYLIDKIVKINFPEQTIKIGGSYNLSDYEIKPLNTLNGRPVVKLILNKKEQNLLYDTGSSLFGVWTSKKSWDQLREKSDKIESFPITSWGKVNIGYYSSIDQTITPLIEGFDAGPDLKVWYVNNKNYRKFFRQNGLFGIMGNQLFLNKELVLDFKKGIFGAKTVCN